MHTNINHPELAEGEVFMGNATPFEFHNCYGWKTKRLGDSAYDVNEKTISGLYPVFVQKSELIEGGINLDQISSYFPPTHV
mgnify:FL=1